MLTNRRVRFLLCFGPPAVYLLVFMALPYGYMFYFSFLKTSGYSIVAEFNIDSYIRAITNPLYLGVLFRTVKIALIVTFFSVVLGYSLAFYMAFIASKGQKRLLYFLMVIPLWTSFLLRVFIWKLILGREGAINEALLFLGLVDEPLMVILYNEFSVILTLVYVFTPFVALPVFASLEKIPRQYIEASMDLGGGVVRTFRKIVLPLSLPGVVTGATFAFCLCFGDFVTPALLGGPEGLMIAQVIISQFLVAFEWPFGSALAVILVATVIVPVIFASRIEKRDQGANIV